jgi:predicted metal-dependent phosphoesterase TrpH
VSPELAVAAPTPLLKADLHVHSWHSGYASHLRFLRSRDCYTDPESIYRVAKERGMDLVCITDHDSIDGCLEFLARHPNADDFITGEEISCTFPARTRGEKTSPALTIHIGALGMTERLHEEVQPLRDNVFDVVEYLRREGVFCLVNHLFFYYKGAMPVAEYVEALLHACPAIEIRNGAMTREHNRLSARIAASYSALHGRRLACAGGSDAHALAWVATTYTSAPGRTCAEYLASLKAGRAEVHGAHGSRGRMAREIYSVIGGYWAALLGLGRHDLSAGRRLVGVTLSLASLPFQLIPAGVAAGHKAREDRTIQRAAHEWRHHVERGRSNEVSPLGVPVESWMNGESR